MRRYSNLAKPQQLAAGIDDSVTTLQVATTEGYPEPDFILAVKRGEVTVEVMLCTAKDATSFTVTRGYDGTTATAHDAGTWVEHVSAAIDYREAIIPTTDLDTDTEIEEWEGRLVFNEASGDLEMYDGSAWVPLHPPGLIVPFAGASAPNGWLMCQGQAVSRSSYARLFDAIGTTHGVGDGSTTFNLPDLRQRIPMGVAASGTGNALGDTGGTIDHTHTQPAHSHSGPSHDHNLPTTNAAGAHDHSWGTTGDNGSHYHSQPSTGSASVEAALSDNFSSGLVSKSDIDHDHGTHSHSGGSGGGGWSSSIGFTQPDEQSHTHSIGGEDHSHSQGSSGLGSYLVPSRAHDHTHSTSNTSTASSHDHSLPTVNDASSHSHSMGSTGSAGTGSTSSDGDETTGATNPPFLALNYIIRV